MKDSNNKYYVYHLIDPKDNLPFYIGKGYNDRMFNHEKEVKLNISPNENLYLFNSIKEILNENLNIIYKKVKENINEKQAFDLETEEIKKYGRKNNNTGILCNMTDGGEGMSGYKHTDISKKKLSNILKGKPTWSSSHKKEMSERFLGEKNPFYGKHHSKESINKFSKTIKEKYIGKIHPLKGKPKSLEHKKKISEYKKGKVMSEETKRKMSLSQQKRFGIVDDNIKNIIIFMYNIGFGCKSILKKLKQNNNFLYSISKIKSILISNGFNLSLRNKMPIKVECISNDGKINIFNSIKEAEDFIGCGRSNINKIFKKGGFYKQFIIKKIIY